MTGGTARFLPMLPRFPKTFAGLGPHGIGAGSLSVRSIPARICENGCAKTGLAAVGGFPCILR